MASTTIPAKSESLHNFSMNPSEHCFSRGKRSKKNPKVLAPDHVVNLNFTDSKSLDSECGSTKMIKIPALMQTSGNNQVEEDNQVRMDEEKGQDDVSMAKTGNLKPRRGIKKKLLNGEDRVVEGRIGLIPEKKDQSLQEHFEKGNGVRVESKVNVVEKAKKVKFSVSLTRQEIEEDVYSFTGSRPDRKPRKRARAVQKNIDNVFPGLWLKSVRPDSYKVYERSMQG